MHLVGESASGGNNSAAFTKQFAACLVVILAGPPGIGLFGNHTKDIATAGEKALPVELDRGVLLAPCRYRRKHLTQVIPTIAVDEKVRHRRAHVKSDDADGVVGRDSRSGQVKLTTGGSVAMNHVYLALGERYFHCCAELHPF